MLQCFSFEYSVIVLFWILFENLFKWFKQFFKELISIEDLFEFNSSWVFGLIIIACILALFFVGCIFAIVSISICLLKILSKGEQTCDF
jgi:uncharacterized membrane protein